MERTNFEKLQVYQLSEKLADNVWEIVVGWDSFAKDTVGKQIALIEELSPKLNAFLRSVDQRLKG